MSILYNEIQQEIAREAKRILESRFASEPLKVLLEARGSYDEQFWSLCGEMGWTAITLPEDYGGLGLGLVELGLVAEACGAVVCGAPFLGSSFVMSQALVRHGTEELRSQWLPGLAAGEIKGAVAFAEGSDIFPAAPRATIRDGKLTGRKSSVPGGGSADAALVLANMSGKPALALVSLSQPGVRRTVLDTFDNSRVTADLDFDAAEISIIDASDPAAAALYLLQLQSVVTAHEQVGGAQKMLETARDYALTRRAFGQPIAAFQSVKHRLAEDYVLVELARANMIDAATKAGDADFRFAVAAARLSATQAYETVTRDCIQIHGGIGVMWEADLHLHQRRARMLALEQGGSMFWEDQLARDLMSTPK
jgi:acyl-CoA dehydrogenase